MQLTSRPPEPYRDFTISVACAVEPASRTEPGRIDAMYALQSDRHMPAERLFRMKGKAYGSEDEACAAALVAARAHVDRLLNEGEPAD